LAPAWTAGQGLFQIDTNTGDDSWVSQGGTITNASMTQTGYLNSSNDVEAGIHIEDSHIVNVTISGGTFNGPGYASPSTLNGNVAINSAGTSTPTVTGFKACGTVNGSGFANIAMSSGSVATSTFDTALVGGSTPSGNTHPCP